MKIAQIADLWHPASPDSQGGRGFVTGALAKELSNRGHKVTLFASGDSYRSRNCRLVSITKEAQHSRDFDLTILNAYQAYKNAESFDIIHNHIGFGVLPLTKGCKTPTLTTIHYTSVPSLFGGIISEVRSNNYFCALSKYIRNKYKKIPWDACIYNGIYIEDFCFSKKPKDFLLFYSRVSPDKAPHIAIEVAKKTNKKLVIAGMVPTPDLEYFNKKIKPYLNNKNIKFVGPLNYKQKIKFLGKAKAVLLPSQKEENFPLTPLEALSCGTPVIAFKKGGAFGEIITQGKTGYVVKDKKEMEKAVEKINKISRKFCRQYVEKKFHVRKMADGYEKLYKKIINTTKIT